MTVTVRVTGSGTASLSGPGLGISGGQLRLGTSGPGTPLRSARFAISLESVTILTSPGPAQCLLVSTPAVAGMGCAGPTAKSPSPSCTEIILTIPSFEGYI